MKQSIQIAYNYLKNQNFNLKTLKKAISKPRFPGEFDQAFKGELASYIQSFPENRERRFPIHFMNHPDTKTKLCTKRENCWPVSFMMQIQSEHEGPQVCVTLCDPMDHTVHGILQVRILECVAFPFSRGSSQPRIEPRSPALQADSLPAEPPGEAQEYWSG